MTTPNNEGTPLTTYTTRAAIICCGETGEYVSMQDYRKLRSDLTATKQRLEEAALRLKQYRETADNINVLWMSGKLTAGVMCLDLCAPEIANLKAVGLLTDDAALHPSADKAVREGTEDES